MPDAGTVALFLVTALSLILIPGPNMVFVMARSLEQGRKVGVCSALGFSVGYVVHISVAVSGLAAVLQQSAGAYNAVKLVGGVYLTYLGIRTVRKQENAESSTAPAQATLGSAFRQGILTQVLNPATTFFFVSLFPQFVDPAKGGVALQMALFGLLYGTTATTIYAIIGLLTGSVGDWLKAHPRLARGQRWLSGLILIALGLRVLWPFNG